jgi:hypothetical protein
MIKTSILAKYRIQEFIQFISNVLMIVKQHGPDKLKLKALYLSLLQNYGSLHAVYKRDADSELTPQLARLDERRDQAIICLRQIAEGYTHHFNGKQKAAGEQILACIDKYGNRLYSLNYSAETAALKKLGQELLTNPAYTNAIEEMQVTGVVKEMEIANSKFEKLFVQRLGAFSQDEAKTSKELIQLTTEAYRTLVQHMDAHVTLAPSEEYFSLINHINENIEHFNLIVERRKSEGEVAEVDTAEDAGMGESGV